MPNLSMSVPKELKSKMDNFPEINWSEVARQSFNKKLEDLEFLKKFKEKSKLTEEDALRLGREVSKSLSNRLRKLRQ